MAPTAQIVDGVRSSRKARRVPPVIPSNAEIIRIIRTRERWSAQEFCRLTGIGATNTLLSWENGTRNVPVERDHELFAIIQAYEAGGREAIETYLKSN